MPRDDTVAIALRRALGALLTIGGAGLATDLQIHQALGGEADHLAQQIRIPLFSTSSLRSIIGLVIGVIPRFRLAFATRPYRETR